MLVFRPKLKLFPFLDITQDHFYELHSLKVTEGGSLSVKPCLLVHLDKVLLL